MKVNKAIKARFEGGKHYGKVWNKRKRDFKENCYC